MRFIWKWIVVISAGALIAYGMNLFTGVDDGEEREWLRTRNDRPAENDFTAMVRSQSTYGAKQR
jgi:hypothetical protein